MADTTDVPQLDAYLPDLMRFVRSSAHAFEAGELDSWRALEARVRAFFTPAMLDHVDAHLPGWRAMSAYGDNVTLVHVMCVFIALLTCPDYQRATLTHQLLMQWIVLFHDLAKEVHPGRRDHTHPFRSAALTASILPRVGFATTARYSRQITAWMALTSGATMRKPGQADAVQDNDQLPAILAGITNLFGQNTAAALVVKAVLLHQSITVLKDWPQAAPLTEAQLGLYLDRDVVPLLRTMMLVDNDGWNMFDPPIKERFRQETESAFDLIQASQRSQASR